MPVDLVAIVTLTPRTGLSLPDPRSETGQAITSATTIQLAPWRPSDTWSGPIRLGGATYDDALREGQRAAWSHRDDTGLWALQQAADGAWLATRVRAVSNTSTRDRRTFLYGVDRLAFRDALAAVEYRRECTGIRALFTARHALAIGTGPVLIRP